MGKRQCELAGCTKQAASGGTPHCKAHGGGKRCQHEGCSKAARPGTPHCAAHGGGKRCQTEDCIKSALRRHRALVMNLQFSILMAQTTDPSSWH